MGEESMRLRDTPSPLEFLGGGRVRIRFHPPKKESLPPQREVLRTKIAALRAACPVDV